VINFGERTEEECWRHWPDLMTIVEAKVKPERITKDPNKYPRMVKEWWKYWNARPELQAATASLEKVLVTSRVRAGLFTIMPARVIFSEQVVVFRFADFHALAVLQSRVHNLWMHFFSGTALELVRYAPTDCFDTFPLPGDWETHPRLEAAGNAYCGFRAALMVRNNEGLTKTYNRFDDPDESNPDVAQLRELHAEMDRAVLRAYSWDDLAERAEPQFLDETNEDDHKYQGRLFWQTDFRDEVLARLLTLNAERAAAEHENGPFAPRPRAKRAQRGLDQAKLLEIAVADEDD
jgi:hypothetical protein